MPSPATSSPRTIAAGMPSTLPITSSAALAISSATAIMRRVQLVADPVARAAQVEQRPRSRRHRSRRRSCPGATARPNESRDQHRDGLPVSSRSRSRTRAADASGSTGQQDERAGLRARSRSRHPPRRRRSRASSRRSRAAGGTRTMRAASRRITSIRRGSSSPAMLARPLGRLDLVEARSRAPRPSRPPSARRRARRRPPARRLAAISAARSSPCLDLRQARDRDDAQLAGQGRPVRRRPAWTPCSACSRSGSRRSCPRARASSRAGRRRSRAFGHAAGELERELLRARSSPPQTSASPGSPSRGSPPRTTAGPTRRARARSATTSSASEPWCRPGRTPSVGEAQVARDAEHAASRRSRPPARSRSRASHSTCREHDEVGAGDNVLVRASRRRRARARGRLGALCIARADVAPVLAELAAGVSRAPGRRSRCRR